MASVCVRCIYRGYWWWWHVLGSSLTHGLSDDPRGREEKKDDCEEGELCVLDVCVCAASWFFASLRLTLVWLGPGWASFIRHSFAPTGATAPRVGTENETRRVHRERAGRAEEAGARARHQ